MEKMETANKRSLSDKSTSSINIENPEIEYFWSIELSASKPTHTWNEKDEDLEEDDEDFINHTVFIKQACLGEGAVPGETNIVQMESMGGSGKNVQAAIVNLTKGESSMARLDISLSGRIGATFTLISGSGPIFISGNHLMEFPKDDDLIDMSQTESELSMNEEELKERELENGVEDEDEDEDEEDEDEEDEEEESEVVAKKAVKRKGAAPVKGGKPKQKVKMDLDEEEEEDDDDDDEEDDEDEEDEDYEEPLSKKKKPAKEAVLKGKGKGKAKAVVENGKKAKKVKK